MTPSPAPRDLPQRGRQTVYIIEVKLKAGIFPPSGGNEKGGFSLNKSK
jgi:hypothetical protein